jgi:hypothetical protein
MGIAEAVDMPVGTGHPIAAVVGGEGDAHYVRNADVLSRERAVELGPGAEIERATVGTHEYVTQSRGRWQDGPDVVYVLAKAR